MCFSLLWELLRGKTVSADLKYVLEVARQIGTVIDDYAVVVDKIHGCRWEPQIKSGHRSAKNLRAPGKTNIDFDVVSNPEFLKEGGCG